jgi:outer membrane lipoprotein carrier protein
MREQPLNMANADDACDLVDSGDPAPQGRRRLLRALPALAGVAVCPGLIGLGLQAGAVTAATAATTAPVGSTAPASAPAVQALRAFVRDVRSGRGRFTQTVTSPDGKRSKTSTGRFAFLRPDRFRFDYLAPYPQTIVADGSRLWLHDPDLSQASSRPLSSALGATPAAILTGRSPDEAFELSRAADRDGLSWVQARPRRVDGSITELHIGFDAARLAAIEIVDGFGQRSMLRFEAFEAGAALTEADFRFVPPPGTDVVTQ